MASSSLRSVLLLGLTLFLLSSPSLEGSVFRALSVEEVTAASDAVVEGTVLRVESSWNAERTLIFSEAEVAVDRVLRGRAGGTVTVRTVGGMVDGYTIVADGFPSLAEGESVLLFLTSEAGHFRITGYRFGHYRLQPDALGRQMALPTVEGLAPTRDRGALGSQPRSLEDLREQISDSRAGSSLHRTAAPFVLLSPPRTWDSAPTFIVDDRGLASIADGDGGVTATVNALKSNQAWNGAGCGVVVNAIVGSVASFSLGDGTPMLNFQDPFNVCTGNCLAGTFTGFFSNRGDGTVRIDDADIVFNSGGFAWTSEGEDPSGAGCSSELYVESVAVHEMGHALGLGHTNVSGATMFPSFSSCNNGPATIEQDDAGGLGVLYGGGPKGPKDPEPACGGSSSNPDELLRGIDLWTTPDDGNSVLHVVFPQDLFCGGESAWFERDVALRGVPIATSPADVLGTTDTVIERLGDTLFGSNVATADLRIRALSLQSSAPVIVNCPDGTQEAWDMFVSLDGTQSKGSLTIRRDASGEGGDFDATVPVSARLDFKNVVTGATAGPLTDVQTLQSSAQPWLPQPGEAGIGYPNCLQIDTDGDGVPDTSVPGTSDFAPGWKEDAVSGLPTRQPLPHPPHVPLPPLPKCDP